MPIDRKNKQHESKIDSVNSANPVDYLDYMILTPSYNRGNLLLDIVLDLAEEAERCGYRVLHGIIDDCSTKHTEAYEAVSTAKWGVNYQVLYQRHTENYGKVEFWRTNNDLFEMARRNPSKYIIMIPDDAYPCKDFFTRTAEHFERLKDRDPNICAMNILCTILINWHFCRFLDECFISDRRLLEAIDWKFHNQGVQNGTCSRTGMQMSFRLHQHKKLVIAPNQDISYLRLLEASESVMYPKEVYPNRPTNWWRHNFVDDKWHKELLF